MRMPLVQRKKKVRQIGKTNTKKAKIEKTDNQESGNENVGQKTESSSKIRSKCIVNIRYVSVLTGQHLSVGTVRDGKEMGWHFIVSTTTVDLHDTVRVDGKAFVGIDYNAKQTRVGLPLEKR